MKLLKNNTATVTCEFTHEEFTMLISCTRNTQVGIGLFLDEYQFHIGFDKEPVKELFLQLENSAQQCRAFRFTNRYWCGGRRRKLTLSEGV